MPRSPDRLNLEHLKKQAKDLVRGYRQRDAAALDRFRRTLPTAAGRSDDGIAALNLRLHDAQLCLAHEHGFASWPDLRHYLDAQPSADAAQADRVQRWLRLVYAGDLHGTTHRANPRIAARVLAQQPDLAAGNPYLACAVGDEAALEQAAATDPGWVNRAGGPLLLPPLLAVTHSSLMRIAEFRARLHCCARLLLEAGADPNQHIGNRWPPASLEQPDERQRLSALYGAAGCNHDVDLTRLLLQAGADPNDGESLYHSLETFACTRLLLEHGADVAGSNVIYHALDHDNAAALELLLQFGGDANEPARNVPLSEWGSPLLWAIQRRRSRRCVELLLDAGADPRATTRSGVSTYRLAMQFGLPEIAGLLGEVTAPEPLSDEERFIAACARGDEREARTVQAQRPELPAGLPQAQLRFLADMAASGNDGAVRVMVTLGWPIAVRGGDWDASALNLAVFRGDSELTRFLLDHGAEWTEQHGHGDNACGTLSWASCNEPVEGGDWAGCARALLDHGMPRATPGPEGADWVEIGGQKKRFSDEVREILLDEA